MTRRLPASLCLLGAVAVSACSLQAQSPVPPSRRPVAVQPEQNASAKPITGEVPAEMIEKLRADLVKQKGVNAADVKVVSAEAVIWPDGGLGCTRPGEIVTQATVPGYRVELEAKGQHYAYHAAERGHFRLCENPTSRGLGRDSVR